MARRRSPAHPRRSSLPSWKSRTARRRRKRAAKEMTGKKEKTEEDDLRANLTMDSTRSPSRSSTGATALILPRASPRHKSPRSRRPRALTSSRHPRKSPKSSSYWRRRLASSTSSCKGAILCLIGYILNKSVDNLYLCIVLSGVVTITGIFEYLQEKKPATSWQALLACFRSRRLSCAKASGQRLNPRTSAKATSSRSRPETRFQLTFA